MTSIFETALQRWRLILGGPADPEGKVSLDTHYAGVDAALEILYDANSKGGLRQSSPRVCRWLGDIRRYFPSSVVQLLQRDALERLGLTQMLLEPEVLESVEPDVHLAAVLLSLQKVMPEETRQTARAVVQKITKELEQLLAPALREAVENAARRAGQTRRPRPRDIDWKRTLYRNLKHYQPELRSIIPQQRYGFARRSKALRHVILALDQSGSMADSLVYASIFGAVLASLRSIRTHLFVFDTAVVDLSAHLHDPVELLFATQLGGGTDIAKALSYAQTLIDAAQDTILVLISDLFEGGTSAEMFKKAHALQSSGVTLIVLLALTDAGIPAYDRSNAAVLASMGIPVFACTPQRFPELIAAAIQQQDLMHWNKIR
ncbi:MAG: VWA domain-containing protein [Saprospiraceae bacterium]|nr:VWA domain-containing protein [Saprospiraceae bacterium]MDW8483512.1 VWA domain-containing protein [Saprospiraceae bacterium]